MNKLKWVLVIVITVMWTAAGFAGDQEKKDKGKKAQHDTFFEVARFIMAKEEIQIYKNLKDIKEKEKLKEDFWEKRDPRPDNQGNESKNEFYISIAVANKWFREGTKGKGWNTERGRILLQLGFPDERKFESSPLTYNGRLWSTKRTRWERWVYYRYNLVLLFAGEDDGAARLELVDIPSELSQALEKSKFIMNLTSKAVSKNSLVFDVNYNTGGLTFAIPVKRLSFEEKADQMTVELDIKVYVYRDDEKIDQISIPKTISLAREELLKMKNIEFEVPYSLKEKGKYFFDVVMEEKATAEKSRGFAKYKI